MTTFDQETLGRIVRAAWVEYCRANDDTKPSHIAPWEELGQWDRAADIAIGVAVTQYILRAVRLHADALNAVAQRALTELVYGIREEI